MAFPRFLSNLAGTRWGTFYSGELRTRTGNTGGGDVLARSFLAAPAGFYYITDATGTVVGFIGPDGAPATYFTMGGGTGPVGSETDPFSINIATGQVIIPNLKHAANISLVSGVPLGTVFAVSSGEARSVVGGSWTITGWTLITDVALASKGASIEVRKQTFSAYDGTSWSTMSGTTNATGGVPRTGSSALKNSSTDIHLWSSTTLNEGDVISSVVSNNDSDIAWYSLMLHGIKVEK